jgi:hypothetical protein
MTRRRQAITLLQATQKSAVLASLSEQVRESQARLLAIEPLIPPNLKSSVKAGPIEGSSWCLLVSNSAAAAKLKQLSPLLTSHLHRQGWQHTTIRFKIQASSTR